MPTGREFVLKKPLIAICAVLILAPYSAEAQVNTAALFGTVLDSSAHSIPAASITITSTDTGAAQRTESNTEGLFTFSALLPGTYDLLIGAPGFESRLEQRVRLTAGQRLRATYPLSPASVKQTIEVSGEAAFVNADNAEQRTTISTREVERLPLAKRDWTGLTTLSTGLQFNDERGTLIVNGLPSSGFRFTADGVDAGGQSYLPAFSQYQNYNLIKGVSRDSIAEVAITRGIASADVGPTMSGNVNVITRSGTNQLHGSVFWLNNVEDFNGRNQFAADRQPVVYNQYGASLGGPILSNRLFYFLNYEGYQIRAQTNVSGTVPTPEFRASSIAAQPVYKPWFGIFPDPNQPYLPGSVTGFYQGSGAQRDSDNYGNARVDYYINNHAQSFFRYTRARPEQEVPKVSPVNPRARGGYTEGGVGSLFYTAGRWLLETRGGFNLNDEQRLDGLFTLGVNSIRRLNGIDAGSGEDLFQGGNTATFGQTATWNRGSHTVKFGASTMYS